MRKGNAVIVLALMLIYTNPLYAICEFDRTRLEINSDNDGVKSIIYTGKSCDTKSDVAKYVLNEAIESCESLQLEIDLKVRFEDVVTFGIMSGPGGYQRQSPGKSFEFPVADAIVNCSSK